MRVVGLDLETAPRGGEPQVYALQPWRGVLPVQLAFITSCAVATSDGRARSIHPGDIKSELRSLRDQGAPIVTWNGLFDVAWMYAEDHEAELEGLQVYDAMLLWKWAENSQAKEAIPAWSLVDAAKRWLTDVVWLPKFLTLKENAPPPGENDAYWELRGKMDAIVTAMVAERILAVLDERQRRAASIEAECILPFARSWVEGVPLNMGLVGEKIPVVTSEMYELERKLGLLGYADVKADVQLYGTRDEIRTQMEAIEAKGEAVPVRYSLVPDIPRDAWAPSAILTSPQRMGRLLYGLWGLPVMRVTKSEDNPQPATDKGALMYLADADDRVLDILRWRKLNTELTKYLWGSLACEEYLESSTTHAAPRIFGTYTGRATYASRSGSKGEAHRAKIGVPLHQWPRPKEIRALIRAPRG